MTRWPLWFVALLVFPAAHVLVAPYTKVEESFTLHAAHDVLRHGLWPSNFDQWDHRTFPGAVPRSFLPPILLGVLSWPSAVLATASGLVTTSIGIQVIVRLTLVAIFAAAFTHLARTLEKRYNTATAGGFVAFTLAQFHIPYYAGRTLPNFTALPLVVLAFSYLLSARYWAGIALLTSVATVIRLEVALLAVPIALALVIHRRMSLVSALTAGMVGGFGSLAISAPIDYALWAPTLPHPSLPDFTSRHTLWPELSAALWNLAGHADEWGVMPAHFYATSLAKMLFGALPLLLLGLVWALLLAVTGQKGRVWENKTLQRTIGDVSRTLGPGVVSLIGVLSTVGHKEWRFIVYAIPPMNILAGSTAAALCTLPSRGLRMLARLGVIGLLSLSAAFGMFSTWVSTHNYPGGAVWSALESARVPEGAKIHFHSYPLQTGASLFTFLRADVSPSLAFPSPPDTKWIYSKSEEPSLQTPQGAWLADLDYVVTPYWREFIEGEIDGARLWRVVGEAEGFDGVKFGGKRGVEVVTSRKIAVLKRL